MEIVSGKIGFFGAAESKNNGHIWRISEFDVGGRTFRMIDVDQRIYALLEQCQTQGREVELQLQSGTSRGVLMLLFTMMATLGIFWIFVPKLIGEVAAAFNPIVVSARAL